ncbi:response regulator [Paenibacillus donghaensis]|uniref:response regulator n=1 Tax=Paenibacillus donghaensis TaxID=414771 RepID=UPI00188326DC|nr:response regulator [Paenibacillus donghaensis]MBE9915106.1 response regulator [Paenibacillus donghaensis]
MKLLLADDEWIIRDGIANKIDWSSLGIKIAGAAENGEEALGILKKESVDILVTDILMPQMDGIRLAEEARKLHPNIKIIILSGYEEFEFAKRALELSVMKYLLKPFTRKELEEAVLQARGEVESMRKVEEHLQTALSTLEKSFPLLRERYLSLWVAGKITPSDIPARLQTIHLKLLGRHFAVMITELDDIESIPSESAVNKELLPVVVSNEIERFMGDYGKGITFHGDHDRIVTIVHDLQEEAPDERFEWAEKLKQHIQDKFGITVSVGVGGLKEGYEGVADSYKEALEAIEYRFLVGRNTVIPVELIHPHPSTVWPGTSDKHANRITAAIRAGDEREIREHLNEFFQQLREAARLSISDIKLYSIEFAAKIVMSSLQSGLRLKDVYGREYDPYAAILQYKTMDDLHRGLASLLLDISHYFLDSRGSKKHRMIDFAIRYIQENYSVENLSINTLSDQLRVHPSYFSRLFKQEVGLTFTDFLTKVRIDKAKQYLGDASLRVSEITFMVGLKDPFYFSTLFKKHVGKNPTEFREQG